MHVQNFSPKINHKRHFSKEKNKTMSIEFLDALSTFIKQGVPHIRKMHDLNVLSKFFFERIPNLFKRNSTYIDLLKMYKFYNNQYSDEI